MNIITQSTGWKRTIGIVILLVSQLLKQSGIVLPDDLDKTVENVMDAVGSLIAAWGVIHAIVVQVIAKIKAKKALPPVAPLLLLALVPLFLAAPATAADRFDQPFAYFFSPRPAVTYQAAAALKMAKESGAELTQAAYWQFKPEISIPALKITESTRPGAMLDVTIFTSAGGGVTYERSTLRDGKNYAPIAFSLMAFLSGNSADKQPIDIAGGFTVEFFNHLIQLGTGYNFGANGGPFGLLSAGFALGQNK